MAGCKFTVYRDNRGEYRWRFQAGNNEIIATSSEGYTEKRSCYHSIEIIVNESGKAEIIEDI